MPCYDGGEYREDAALRRRLDEVTQILCDLCRSLRDRNILMTTDAWVWWSLHERFDRGKADLMFEVHKELMNGTEEEVGELG